MFKKFTIIAILPLLFSCPTTLPYVAFEKWSGETQTLVAGSTFSTYANLTSTTAKATDNVILALNEYDDFDTSDDSDGNPDITALKGTSINYVNDYKSILITANAGYTMNIVKDDSTPYSFAMLDDETYTSLTMDIAGFMQSDNNDFKKFGVKILTIEFLEGETVVKTYDVEL